MPGPAAIVAGQKLIQGVGVWEEVIREVGMGTLVTGLRGKGSLIAQVRKVIFVLYTDIEIIDFGF